MVHLTVQRKQVETQCQFQQRKFGNFIVATDPAFPVSAVRAHVCVCMCSHGLAVAAIEPIETVWNVSDLIDLIEGCSSNSFSPTKGK